MRTCCPAPERCLANNAAVIAWAAVKAVVRPDLNLVGLAVRAERKVVDKIVDGLKFHS